MDNFLLHPDPSNATHASFAVQNTGSPTVTVSVAAHTGTTFPNVAASNVFMYSYRPATTIAFVNTAEGSTTTSTQDDLVVTFATPVVGAGPGNLRCNGATVDEAHARQVTETSFAVPVMFGVANVVSCTIDEAAPGIVPPNAAAAPVSIVYQPRVLVTWSEESVSDGATVSATALVARLTFGSAVTGVSAASVSTSGCTVSSVVSVSPSVYDVAVAVTGDTAAVGVDVVSGATGVVPANAVASPLGGVTVVYAPSVVLSSPSVSASGGTTTSETSIVVTLTFGSVVSGVSLGDVEVVGGVASDLMSTGDTTYSVTVSLGTSSSVSVSVAASAGVISPANAASNTLTFTYAPAVVLSGSVGGDVVVAGSTVSVLAMRVTATFASDVAGVSESDFQVSGATVSSGSLVVESPSMASVEVSMGDGEAVTVWMDALSGAISPGNAASVQPFTVVYSVGVSLAWPSPLVSGGTTSDTTVSVTATFASDVTSVLPSDLVVAGASVIGFTPVDGREYQWELSLGAASLVTVSMLEGSGSITPGNAESSLLLLEYWPIVALSWDNQEFGSRDARLFVNLHGRASELHADDFWLAGGDIVGLSSSSASADTIVFDVVARPGAANVSVAMLDVTCQRLKVVVPTTVWHRRSAATLAARRTDRLNDAHRFVTLRISEPVLGDLSPQHFVCSGCEVSSVARAPVPASSDFVIEVSLYLNSSSAALSVGALRGALSMDIVPPPPIHFRLVSTVSIVGHNVSSGVSIAHQVASLGVVLSPERPDATLEQSDVQIDGPCSIVSMTQQRASYYTLMVDMTGTSRCLVHVLPSDDAALLQRSASAVFELRHLPTANVLWNGRPALDGPFVVNYRPCLVQILLSAPIAGFEAHHVVFVGAELTSWTKVSPVLYNVTMNIVDAFASVFVPASTHESTLQPYSGSIALILRVGMFGGRPCA